MPVLLLLRSQPPAAVTLNAAAKAFLAAEFAFEAAVKAAWSSLKDIFLGFGGSMPHSIKINT